LPGSSLPGRVPPIGRARPSSENRRPDATASFFMACARPPSAPAGVGRPARAQGRPAGNLGRFRRDPGAGGPRRRRREAGGPAKIPGPCGQGSGEVEAEDRPFPGRPIDSRRSNQVGRRQVFWLPAPGSSFPTVRGVNLSRRAFPSLRDSGFCGGRRRSQRRVRGRFSRPSLFAPARAGTPATPQMLGDSDSPVKNFPPLFRPRRKANHKGHKGHKEHQGHLEEEEAVAWMRGRQHLLCGRAEAPRRSAPLLGAPDKTTSPQPATARPVAVPGRSQKAQRPVSHKHNSIHNLCVLRIFHDLFFP
jgi:hypothetical protein